MVYVHVLYITEELIALCQGHTSDCVLLPAGQDIPGGPHLSGTWKRFVLELWSSLSWHV